MRRRSCAQPVKGLGRGAVLVIGIDLVKDVEVLRAAYNDAAGVTAAFNLNLLHRINTELGADFDVDAFSHCAFYNHDKRRIEMHLASRVAQKVRVCGRMFEFRRGETIHTENSYKYTIEAFQALAAGSGWRSAAVWTDAQRYLCTRSFATDSRQDRPDGIAASVARPRQARYSRAVRLQGVRPTQSRGGIMQDAAARGARADWAPISVGPAGARSPSCSSRL